MLLLLRTAQTAPVTPAGRTLAIEAENRASTSGRLTKIKDSGAVLDYCFDWKPLTNGFAGAAYDWLQAGETITVYSVTTSTGITKGVVSEASGKVTVWLSGGTAGTYYTAVCRITTSAGRTDDRTIKIYVTER